MVTAAVTKASKQVFLKAFESSFGNITIACKAAKVGRTTYYKWKENDPKFLAEVEGDALAALGERRKDFLEHALFRLQIKGNVRAIMAGLNNFARDRGYGNRLFIEHGQGPKLVRPATMPPEKDIVEIPENAEYLTPVAEMVEDMRIKRNVLGVEPEPIIELSPEEDTDGHTA